MVVRLARVSKKFADGAVFLQRHVVQCVIETNVLLSLIMDVLLDSGLVQ